MVGFIHQCLNFNVSLETCSFKSSLSSHPFNRNSPFFNLAFASSAVNDWIYPTMVLTLLNSLSLIGFFIIPLINYKLLNWIIFISLSLSLGLLSSSAIFHVLYLDYIKESLLVQTLGTNLLVYICSFYAFYALDCIFRIINSYFHYNGEEIVCKTNTKHTNSSSIWLIVIGDIIHNFVDGIAIGSSFNKSLKNGMNVSLSVILEELPHELSNFIVIMGSGLSWNKAILFNLLSTAMSFIGFGLGYFGGRFSKNLEEQINAFTAGLFLYISFIFIMPECIEKIRQLSGNKWYLLLVNSSLSLILTITGVAYVYSFYE